MKIFSKRYTTTLPHLKRRALPFKKAKEYQTTIQLLPIANQKQKSNHLATLVPPQEQINMQRKKKMKMSLIILKFSSHKTLGATFGVFMYFIFYRSCGII